MTRPSTARELAAALRRSAASSLAAGRAHSWHPAQGAPTWGLWERAVNREDLALTVLEGEVHAALLVQSALQHASAVSRAVAHADPFVAHTTGRTAVEHALRALHYLDGTATERERAGRRLLEWLHAAREHERLVAHQGDPSLVGAQTANARRRAESLGLAVDITARRIQVDGRSRDTTMRLAEMYLAGPEGAGVPGFLLRLHAAMEHGLETGLLSDVAEAVGPLGVNVMRPCAPDPGRLSLELLAVPLAVLAAFRALSERYGWNPTEQKLSAQRLEHDRTIQLWQNTVSHHLDGAE